MSSIAVLAIIAGITFYIIIPKFYTKDHGNVYGGLSSDLIISTQATTTSHTNLIDNDIRKISTTTDSGLPVVIIFTPCDNKTQKVGDNKVWQICFGSSRNGAYDQHNIEVWNLAPEVNIAKFGVFHIEAKNSPYVVSVDFGNHTPTQKELEYFKKEMSTLFLENVIDSNACFGIPDAECRE